MVRFVIVAVCTAVVGVIVAGFAGSGKGHNFSQFPGFAEHFSMYPPSGDLPGANDQALLEKHKPRIFLPARHAGLIDFYRDYIANGVLKNGSGEMISGQVTPEILNHHKDDAEVVFTHRPAPAGHKSTPVVMGRVERSPIDLGDGPVNYTFLTYHAVFAHSGLPAGLLGWQTIGLSVLGDLDDWHQLDHYTAATVVLDGTDEPVAMMLQQHNYQRTFLFGETVHLPSDGRPLIDVAIRSNELYPHKPGRTNRPAVSFLNPKAWRYMIGAGPRLMLTADDITEPVHEKNYQLRFLAPDDAFYTFKGYLGARRWLMGRSGPPGANYKTLPKFLPYDRQLTMGYWRRGNGHDIVTLERALKEPNYNLEFTNAQGAVFKANLLCLKRWRADCAFQ